MDKDINRIKAVLAEKGGVMSLPSVSWRDAREPISGWQNSWDMYLQLYKMWCTNDCQPTMESNIKIARLLDVGFNELVRME